MVDWFIGIIDFILHIDRHLQEMVTQYGFWTYIILFLIVFCETGLIVTPLLPGDSLLFAAGALAGMGHFDPILLSFLIAIAAILGDACNYALARRFGSWAVEQKWLIKKEHLDETAAFFEKHGAKTIVMARFVPIVRTFAPFVAGVGKMNYGQFSRYNIFGACLWVALFVPCGYFFGNHPAVQKNFTLVILGVIFVSILPLLYRAASSIWKRRQPVEKSA